MAKTTARGRRISKALRKHHAIARQIAKKEKIPYLEARHRTTETFIDAIRRGGRKAATTWIRVTPAEKPARWKRIDAQVIRDVKTFEDASRLSHGRRVGFERVRRSTAQFQYWSIVDRTARQFDLSIADARKLLSRMREEMARTARQYGKKRSYRVRDAAAVLEYSDRYQNIRMEFGL
jgi:hypothetical protein